MPLFDSSKKNTPEENSSLQPKLQPFIQPKIKSAIQPNVTKKKSGTEKTELPEDVKGKMEKSFGTDFSDVNIHKNSSEADELGAKAYAQGQDLHFAPGEFNPQSLSGQELIGHELAHVVQQKDGRVKTGDINEKGPINDSPDLEKEADEQGSKAARGIPVSNGLKLASPAGSGDKPVQMSQDTSAQHIARAKRLYDAFDGWGTDEEAVMAVLKEVKYDGQKITGLKYAYKKQYNESLDLRLVDEMEGVQLAIAKIYLQPTFNNDPATTAPNVTKPKVNDSPITPGLRRVNQDKGPVYLRSTPDSTSMFNILAVLKFNDLVDTLGAERGGWAKVNYHSLPGFVDRTALSSILPAKDANLYRVKSGDTIEQMFYTMGYGTKVPEKSFFEKMSFDYSEADVLNDPRFFANALYYLNNLTPKSDPAIYKDGGGGLDLFNLSYKNDYKLMKVKANYMLWLPSKEFLKGLIGVIKPGSIKGNAEYAVAEQVEKYWKDGYGVTLNAGIGATFAIPVGVDGSQSFNAIRQGSKITIKAQYTVAGGLDTGIGAGLFVGTGKKKADGTRMGFGAQAGANLEAKAKMLAYDEYTFEYKKPGAMASAIFIALSKGAIGVNALVPNAMYELGNYMTNPEKYLTKRKFELGAFARGAAEATAGVHNGETEDGSNKHKWSSRDKADQKASTEWTPDNPAIKYSPLGSMIKGFLNIGISANATMEALGGVETGFNGNKVNSKYYFQFTAGVNATLPGPLAPLSALFPGNGGVAIVLQSTHEKGQEATPILQRDIVIKIIKGEANMDFANGSGTEISLPPIKGGIEAIPGILKNLGSTYQGIKDDPKSILKLFNGLEIEKMMEFPVSAGGLDRRMGRQQGVKRLLKDNLKKRDLLKGIGGNMSGVLHMKFSFNNLETKTTEIIALIEKIKGLDLKKLYKIVHDFYSKGEVNPEFEDIINLFLSVTSVDLLEVIISGSVGIAGGASASMGAKVRLEGFMNAGIYHKFVLKPEGGKADMNTIRELTSF